MNVAYRRIFRTESTGTSAKRKKKQQEEWKEYKDQCAQSMPYIGGSFQTMASIARLDPEIFDLVKIIFEGRFKVNKQLRGQQKPVALTHFQKMGNVPTEHLIRWLTRVVNGESTCKQFDERITWFKKRVMVQKKSYPTCK